MVRLGKGVTISLTLKTSRISINKINARTANTDIVPQYFMMLLQEFKDLPYLGYRNRKVKKEPAGSYFFLVKKIISYLITISTFYYVTKELSLAASTKNIWTKQLNLKLYQWIRENKNVPRKLILATVKHTEKKRPQVHMITRTRKRKKQWMNLKIILVFMNVTKKSANQRTN